jgi:hypothetical protein
LSAAKVQKLIDDQRTEYYRRADNDQSAIPGLTDDENLAARTAAMAALERMAAQSRRDFMFNLTGRSTGCSAGMVNSLALPLQFFLSLTLA